MRTIEEALETILALVPGPRVERVGVRDACGRYLAEDVEADRDMPPADRSLMDGYAVAAADLRVAPVELECVGEVAAGAAGEATVRPGTCVRIFTGASVPGGADAVAMVETTEELAGGRVRFLKQASPGMHVRHRGEDAARGAVLIGRGTPLGTAQVAACAAAGRDPVAVFRVPEVAVICTGEEIRGASGPVKDHEERNSNGPAVMAALSSLGVRGARDMGVVGDRPDAISSCLLGALGGADAVVMTGGVSKGAYDLVPDAVEAAGGTIRLHEVRIRPGKPFLFATIGEKPVFCLPGNPLGVIVTFWELVAPAIRAMMGDPRPGPWVLRARLGCAASAGGDRILMAPARIEMGPDGNVATPVGHRSAADLAAGGRANGVVRLDPATGRYEEGAIVEAHLWTRPL